MSKPQTLEDVLKDYERHFDSLNQDQVCKLTETLRKAIEQRDGHLSLGITRQLYEEGKTKDDNTLLKILTGSDAKGE